MQLLLSVINCLYIRVKIFVFMVNSRRLRFGDTSCHFDTGLTYPLYGTVLFSQAMQEAMTESKAKKFFLYSGHDYTGSFASDLV